jgi:hypothetical protein
MKPTSAFLCPLVLAFAGSAALAQTPAPPAWHEPKYSDIYCAGFIADRPVESGLFVVTGEERGLKQIYSERDTIFLSRGAGTIVNPGGEYMLLRAATDPERQEFFKGQQALLRSLGTLYKEVGRIKVNIVHEKTATAWVMNSCQEIQAGDVAIPFDQKPIPKFQAAGFDRFAPPSGKNEGMIVTGKEFLNTLGTGDKVYLNIGANNGVEVGQSYRIYRTFLPGVKDPAGAYATGHVPEYLGMERLNFKLKDHQKRALPRDVIGEMVILWVGGKSATGYITMATTEIYSGDQVELK